MVLGISSNTVIFTYLKLSLISSLGTTLDKDKTVVLLPYFQFQSKVAKKVMEGYLST